MATDIEMVLDGLIARVARVRRWLLALSVLRMAALTLAFLCVYVGLYAWIDHHLHFGRLGRVSAFTLFAGLSIVGLACIVRVLRRHMTYSHAANYIESRRSFQQQLAAAVEYYEGRSDYPYSEALARQLVLQVDRAAGGCRLDAVVEKWQGYLLGGLVFLSLLVIGLFVRQNVLFISAYLSRLVRPFAAIEPVPATILETKTENIVTAPDTPVTLAAQVRGRVPPVVTLVVTRHDPNDPNTRESERMELIPVLDPEGRAIVMAAKSFDTTGQFEYRFETPEGQSAPHTIRVNEPPSIKGVTATITPPAPEGTPPLAYKQPVRDGTLEVLPYSRVQFDVQASAPLQEATMTVRSGGRPQTQSLNGADRFSFQHTADTSSSIGLSLVATDGLANTPQELRIVLKADEGPQFKLVSPEGDYLATDVSSIPIEFEVTDDFGLVSARLVCELAGSAPVVLHLASPQGAKQASLAHTLELEQYDLHVGDSILFYAAAADVDTGHKRTDANACSDIYFIEIRPYRQYWHPDQNSGEPSQRPGPVYEDLITILEYTRGILKRTWPLAHTPQLREQEQSKLDAIGQDAQYCARRLAVMRDDPEAGFSSHDQSTLTGIIEYYDQAKDRLSHGDVSEALSAEQGAYRTLRKFIDELHIKWSPPQSGPSSPQQTPERVRLQEQPQVEKERIESELKEMQQKVDALARRQQSLKSELAKAMQQQEQAGPGASSVARNPADRREQSSSDGSQARQGQEHEAAPSAPQPDPSGQRDGTQGSQSMSSADSGVQADQSSTGQGRSQAQGGDRSQGQGQGQGQGRERGGAATPGPNGEVPGEQSRSSSAAPGARAEGTSSDSRSASSSGGKPGRAAAERDVRLRMLQARQKALREEATQLNTELGRLPVPGYSSQGAAQEKAQEHLGRAIESMKQFEERLADARYESAASSEAAGDMAKPADAAAKRLTDAGTAIRQGLSEKDPQTTADQAEKMAKLLAGDAEAYDESLSEAEKNEMLARLAAAERLLESMAGAQWTTVSSGGGPANVHVYTKDGHATPAQTARLLARQFWSVALEARKHEGRPVENEPSDAEFFEAENEFFERAARFRQGVEK